MSVECIVVPLEGVLAAGFGLITARWWEVKKPKVRGDLLNARGGPSRKHRGIDAAQLGRLGIRLRVKEPTCWPKVEIEDDLCRKPRHP